MNIISLIQPSELGPDFKFNPESRIWEVNFPTSAEPPPPISNDARNIIQNLGDGMFVDQRNRLAYAMVQDNQTQKIQLWQFPADEVFNTSTATMVSEIDMLAMNGQFDDIAIDEGVITFTDAQTGSTLTLNTNELQRVGSIKSTNTVEVTEAAGVLKLTARIDPQENNLLEVTAGGLQVTPTKIDQIFNDKLAKMDIHTQAMFSTEYDGVKHVIGDQITTIPKVQLANSAGQYLALVNDPEALQKSEYFKYPHEVQINNFVDNGDGAQTNITTANFSMRVNGTLYFSSKPDLLGEDLSIVPDANLYTYVSSGGVLFIGCNWLNNDVDFTPITIVVSPTTEQKAYSNKFLDNYRGAKVLPNGDLEFVLVPREPS